jgi:hypothetical protein
MVLDLATLVADKPLLASLTREYELLKANDGALRRTAATSRCCCPPHSALAPGNHHRLKRALLPLCHMQLAPTLSSGLFGA